ncbi:MAG: hypothetical protein JAY82_10970 [Candidatus Thiodiazotropha taylori]|nr:hypothetical protein [Candidatus Thiodiazotropha taylori]
MSKHWPDSLHSYRTNQDGEGTTDYQYSAFGDLTQVTRTSQDGVTTTFSYSYNPQGQLVSQTYPSGHVVHYTYAQGQLTGLNLEKPDGTTQALVSQIQRLPFGPINAQTFGNGLQLNRTFDQDYQLIAQTLGNVLDDSYGHDPVGNITSWQDLLQTSRNQSFDYDELDRLTSALGAYGDLGYSYDAIGNRLSKTEDGVSETYSYILDTHRLEEILGSTTDSRQYDAAGNTISSLLGSYTYDDQNRMVGFSKTGTAASYGYNGKGERVRKTVNGTLTRFRFGPNGALLGEYDQMGQAMREYVYLEGQPVAQLQGPVPVQVSYLHTDHLGAVVKATDGAGSVVWDSDRKPFGDRTVTVAQVEMPLGFPGQYYDQETGNYYNYFRDYDPSTGRYLQIDPISVGEHVQRWLNRRITAQYLVRSGNQLTALGGMLGQASIGTMTPELNAYGYTLQNPLRYVDPFGLATCGHYPPGHPLRWICENSPGDEGKLECVRICLKEELPPNDNTPNICEHADWYFYDHPVCWWECDWLPWPW